MSSPLVISHLVMVCDAAEREASRVHLCALLRDHHLPQPDAYTSHLRMVVGAVRIRWELHTEFVTWTFSCSLDATGFGDREPATAIEQVPRSWLACMPGHCLAGVHLWVLDSHGSHHGPLVRHFLRDDTRVASTVADGRGEVYTDFALHSDSFVRMVLLTGEFTPRSVGRLVQQLLEVDTYRIVAPLGLLRDFVDLCLDHAEVSFIDANPAQVIDGIVLVVFRFVEKDQLHAEFIDLAAERRDWEVGLAGLRRMATHTSDHLGQAHASHENHLAAALSSSCQTPR